MINQQRIRPWVTAVLFILTIVLFGACSAEGEKEDTAVISPASSDSTILLLPNLEAAALDDNSLKVIATTSIIGDVLAQVGGDAIQLTTLMSAGQDPHSFEPAAQDMTAVAQADLIFVNGWDLEEALIEDLEEIGEGVPLIPISANITPLTAEDKQHDDHHEDGDEHDEGSDDHHEDEDEHDEDNHDHHEDGAHEHDNDPHVWLDVAHVKQWVENSNRVLSIVDPNNATEYASNAATYLAELDELEAFISAELAQIPEDKRVMITNHDAFSYFAAAYGFTILGTILPGDSTLAEPSANTLADLVTLMEAQQVCTIFVETAVSTSLAQTVADEIGRCDEVAIVPLYTGTLGPIGSGAESYISMMQANVAAIVENLR